MARQVISCLLLCLCVVSLSACRTAEAVLQVSYPNPVSVPLQRAGAGAQGRLPLNVSIAVFEPAATGEKQPSRALAPVRVAETAYLPVQLRDTLEETGFWGQVRVVPAPESSAEVSVTASIVESSAIELVLDVEVVDATGRTWLNRRFQDVATDFDFESDQAAELNPFQDLFNDVANEMKKAREALSGEAAEDVSRVAMLKYGVELAPDAFSVFLDQENGRWQVVGLPARADPMLQRVREIRERDRDMMEVINDHFTLFAADLQSVYPYWRRYSFELLVYNQSLAGGEVRGRSGSWEAVEDVYELYRELKMNEDELRMMARSFTTEVEPTLLELEGRVVELKGSLSDRVTAWRNLLRRLYQAERGTD